MEEQKSEGRRNNNTAGSSGVVYYLDGISRPSTNLRRNGINYGRPPQSRTVYTSRAHAGIDRPSRHDYVYEVNDRAVNPDKTAPPTINQAADTDLNRPQPQGSLPGYAYPTVEQNPASKLRPVFQKRRSKFKRILKPSLITLAVAVLGFGAWFGISVLHSVDKVFHGNVFSDVHALISGSPLKESNGRINILLAGDSVGDPGHQGAALADSIMVISYDPAAHNGFILSIPRDLWVYIPSMGYQKINAANDVSNFSSPGLPAGGMGQLQQIVQNDLGIPIDYEALIDYAAFKDAVDTVGGITIDIKSSDPRGIYDAYTHLKLPNGWVTLTGQEALDLARARGDNVAGDVSYGLPNSDFSRTEHQRQMLVALIKKALTIGVLSNPVKITDLFNSFSSNISTDLSLGDAISLVRITDSLNVSSLQSVTYSFGGANSLLTNYVAPDGEEALIPSAGENNFSQLKAYFKQLTSSNPIIREAPTVTLLNGSDVSGLASREKTFLESQGFTVSSIANASTTYPTSLIVNNTSGNKPASLAQLEKDIHGQVVTSASGSQEANEATNYTTDFVVIMGKDWDNTGTSGTPIQN
jgi:LCP family protein required for cell wall assembly